MAAMTPGPRDGKRPHPAGRARRVTAVLSGVAFAGLATGMAVEASTPDAHATTRTPDVAPDPTVSTTDPTWSAPLAPQTVDPSPQFLPAPTRQRAHTQTSGS